MRFLVQPGAGRARPPIRTFLAFAALALAGFAVQRIHNGGLSAAGVEAFYLGPGGAEPVSAAALWEEVHIGAFVYGFVVFMLGSLLAVSPVPDGLRRRLLAAAVACALADLFAPFAIVAAARGGALRVVTFALAQASVAALLAAAWVGVGRSGRTARA